MIKRSRDFEGLKSLEDWSGILAQASQHTREDRIRQVFADPRLGDLAGLKLAGRWEDPLFKEFREHTGKLSGLEKLVIWIMGHRDKVLPLRDLLDTFPGLAELEVRGRGWTEPVRHGFLKSLDLHIYYSSRLETQTRKDMHLLESLSGSVFPQLETLKLGFMGHHPDEEGRKQIQLHLPGILSGETFPQLSRLGLTSVMDAKLAEWFAETILACENPSPHLKCLDVSLGVLRTEHFLEQLKQWEPYQRGQLDFQT